LPVLGESNALLEATLCAAVASTHSWDEYVLPAFNPGRTLSPCMKELKAMAPVFVAIASVAAIFSEVPQRTPDDLIDLIGLHASVGQVSLLSRGFLFAGYSGETNRRDTYWWQARTRRCVIVAIRDQQFALITIVAASDCQTKPGVRYVPRLPH
jgi:hypothetical protein